MPFTITSSAVLLLLLLLLLSKNSQILQHTNFLQRAKPPHFQMTIKYQTAAPASNEPKKSFRYRSDLVVNTYPDDLLALIYDSLFAYYPISLQFIHHIGIALPPWLGLCPHVHCRLQVTGPPFHADEE